MAIIYYLCKKEVKIVSFGKGFVGLCCNNILYNSADNSQFDMTTDSKRYISMHSFHQDKNYLIK